MRLWSAISYLLLRRFLPGEMTEIAGKKTLIEDRNDCKSEDGRHERISSSIQQRMMHKRRRIAITDTEEVIRRGPLSRAQ